MTAALDAILRSICRAAIGLTLTLAAATPSLAEVGCIEDAVWNSWKATAIGDDAVVQVPGEDDGDRRSDRPSNCGFGDCAQWVPPAVPGRAISTGGFAGQVYAPFVMHRLGQSVRDGPERPPRA